MSTKMTLPKKCPDCQINLVNKIDTGVSSVICEKCGKNFTSSYEMLTEDVPNSYPENTTGNMKIIME